MIETDMLLAHVKETDWLKETAEAILRAIDSGKLGPICASRESIHELYYLLTRTGTSLDDTLVRIGALTKIRNLNWLPTTTDTDLLALSLMSTYKLSSIFDAYHAAACLLGDPDQTMLSTDSIYETIPRIKREEPREFTKRLSQM
ncbi:MAG: type II toxin-antitoxin system VapC family toxin [Nitrososphaerales archaeon]